MNIGFIGAGKAGTALGRYLVDNNASVVGFASKTYSSACQAASFSRSSAFSSTLDLVRRCDFVFITTPDSVISIVWRELLDGLLIVAVAVLQNFLQNLMSSAFRCAQFILC